MLSAVLEPSWLTISIGITVESAGLPMCTTRLVVIRDSMENQKKHTKVEFFGYPFGYFVGF